MNEEFKHIIYIVIVNLNTRNNINMVEAHYNYGYYNLKF